MPRVYKHEKEPGSSSSSLPLLSDIKQFVAHNGHNGVGSKWQDAVNVISSALIRTHNGNCEWR